MTRAEIEIKIKQTLDSQQEKTSSKCLKYGDTIEDLTDLFIQLSEERLTEQRMNCNDAYFNSCKSEHQNYNVSDAILNAPLPELL